MREDNSIEAIWARLMARFDAIERRFDAQERRMDQLTDLLMWIDERLEGKVSPA